MKQRFKQVLHVLGSTFAIDSLILAQVSVVLAGLHLVVSWASRVDLPVATIQRCDATVDEVLHKTAYSKWIVCAFVSLPKWWIVGIICSVAVRLTHGKTWKVAMLISMVSQIILALLVLTNAEKFGLNYDAFFSAFLYVPQCICMGVASYYNEENHSERPRLMASVLVLGLLIANTTYTLISNYLVGDHSDPVKAVVVSHLLARGYEMVYKTILKYSSGFPIESASLVLFVYHVGCAHVIRRFVMLNVGIWTIEDMWRTSFWSGIVELLANTFSLVLSKCHMEYLSYRDSADLAARCGDISVVGLQSDIIGQEVALHAALVTGLFFDRDLFALYHTSDASSLLYAWGVQWLAEAASNTVSLILMVYIIPARNYNINPLKQMLQLSGLAASATVLASLAGLHRVVREKVLVC
eukprot:TRINITY_DN7211_c0_g2_i1.p1 TRINITY_DN7211_c0_g2~~TRINITY_DN7211_c0_g2_i1.p1  ORF type:complete len:411 (-),score=20.32 TRINITY_DN7211_c0_g2_i1:406-1638(-)